MSPRKTFFWIVHVSEPLYRNNQKEAKFVHQFNKVSLIMTESELLEKDTIEPLNRSPFLIHVSQKVAHILWILLHSKTGSNQRFKRFLTSYQEIFKSLSFTAVDKFKTQHQQAQKQRKEKALPIPLIKKKKHHFLHFQGTSKTFPLQLKKDEAKQTSWIREYAYYSLGCGSL